MGIDIGFLKIFILINSYATTVKWCVLKRLVQYSFALLIFSLTIGCNESSDGQISSTYHSARESNKIFDVRGVVRKISKKESMVHIEHEEIPNYMIAMTMPFSVKNKKELGLIRVGDEVNFELNVTSKESWIEKINVVLHSGNEKLKVEGEANSNLLNLGENGPLRIGDELPNYLLINQENKKIQLNTFRGRILVFTFMYTRCPIPDFCPRMSRNFSEAYDVLKDTGLNNEWHFLSISFDSDFDTPDVLENYSKAYSSNSKRWSFATGNSSVVDEMMLRFGVVVRRPKASITEWDHNLRTVIVGPSGVIRNIYIGNSWTSKTLVEELRRVDKKYLN